MPSEPPDADPHVRWCGGRRGEPGAYPIPFWTMGFEPALVSVAAPATCPVALRARIRRSRLPARLPQFQRRGGGRGEDAREGDRVGRAPGVLRGRDRGGRCGALGGHPCEISDFTGDAAADGARVWSARGILVAQLWDNASQARDAVSQKESPLRTVLLLPTPYRVGPRPESMRSCANMHRRRRRRNGRRCPARTPR
jgi:hypothetical protein